MVYSTFQRAGLSVHLEVGCAWGQDNSRTRPADIHVINWDCGTSAAFDITVASPLNSVNMLEASMYQGVSAKVAPHRKYTENDPKCVLSWAGDVYHWQWRATRGIEGLLTGGYSVSHSW